MRYSFSLVGNPNVGKTSLYNRLTRSFEHIGNWHGVTVSVATKNFFIDTDEVEASDLPGLYSLSVYSPEEAITRDAVLSNAADVIVSVCEVNNIKRNLYLTLQLLECGINTVLAVNMADELKARGLVIHADLLEKRLKIPVAVTSAKHRGQTIQLTQKISEAAKNPKNSAVDLSYLNDLPVAEIAALIYQNAVKIKLNPTFAAIKLLENDLYIENLLKLSPQQVSKIKAYGDLQDKVASLRYDFIEKLMVGVITKKHSQKNYVHGQSIIDKFVLNKYLALPIFLAIMLAVFFITFASLGKVVSDLLGLLIHNFIFIPTQSFFDTSGTPEWIVRLLCDGIIEGVVGVLAFLPQIVLLFFFLALLEDSGYLSRVAFMTDGFFKKLGLSGRASFTLLMGFGCSATAVLTSRGLEDENMRKKTILLTPFLPCSARLPVFSVIAAAYFSKGEPIIVFSMYILGVVTALFLAFLMQKFAKSLKSGTPSFVMEMPPYRLPSPERVFQVILNNVKLFFIRVGTVVFALNIIVWVLSNFSFGYGYTVGTDYQSIFETLGTVLAPIFAPLGFGNWRAVASLMSGIAAKEIVITGIEALGGVEMIFAGEYAMASALSFSVFTLLYVPCIATLAAIKKEIGTRFMIISLFLQLATAYLVSLAVYWTARLFIMDFGLALGLIILIPVLISTAIIIYGIITKEPLCKSCPQTNCGGCKGISNEKVIHKSY